VREFKPTSIVDCAPRTGKTTSAIIQALIKNSSEHPQDINYFIFEKDPSYFDEMKMYLLQTAYELKNKNVNMKVFYDTARRVGQCVGIKFHVDHVVPLSLGGNHHQSNLQWVPYMWNLSKHNRESGKLFSL
jgi:hypothetical protein